MTALIITLPPWPPYWPPQILAILAACCEEANIDYELEDLNIYMHNNFDQSTSVELSNDLYFGEFRSPNTKNTFDLICDRLTNKIINLNPSYVCISVFSIKQCFSANYLLEKIKQVNHTAKIVIGGSGVPCQFQHHKNFGYYCLDNSLVDYSIFGDGELAFQELLKGNFNYPGINKTNQIQITDLDSLPLPSYKKFDLSPYKYGSEPVIMVTGSKGCVRDCTFCDINQMWPKYIYKSGERMAQQLYKLWQETGVTNFYFTDSLVNGSIKNFRQLNKEIIKLKNQNNDFKIKYSGQFICRPVGQLKQSDYEEMSNAGAEMLMVGIESFSNSVRDHMRKKFSNEDIDYHLKLCAEYGIQNTLLILPGYITETLNDHKENLYHLEKYQVYAYSGIISSLNFTMGGLNLIPDAGVPLNSMEEELQIIYTQDDELFRDHNWISLANPDLTVKERYRRTTELLIYSINLGYKVAFLQDHLDNLEKFYSSKTFNNDKKLIPIIA